jgi:glucose/arabinose dehydrogenase
MKIKKAYPLILAAVLICLTLAGCASGGASDDAVSDPQPAEAETSEPVYGSQIQDGTYQIEVSSSSSMFRITDAQLTVKDGNMTAVLTLSGTGYLKLHMGTGEEALADTDDKCIYYVENAEGNYTYEVPVAALDQDIDVAAWSIKKETWYDRTLVFESSMIPADAIAET